MVVCAIETVDAGVGIQECAVSHYAIASNASMLRAALYMYFGVTACNRLQLWAAAHHV